jgi:hypothetical protein
LHFTQAAAHLSERRRRGQEKQKEGRNLRAVVEATMRSIKHPLPADKLPVPEMFRVDFMLISSATVRNVRRIQRYLQTKAKDEIAQPAALGAEKRTQEQAGCSILTFVRTILAAFSGLARPKMLAVGC